MRILGKFTTDGFIQDSKSGRIAKVSKESSLTQLVLRFLDGKIIRYDIHPGNQKADKRLKKRTRDLKVLQISDFQNSTQQCPFRIKKVVTAEEYSDVHVEALLLSTSMNLGADVFLILEKELQEIRKFEDKEIRERVYGNTLQILIRLF